MTLTVIVVGAGIAGLCAAVALRCTGLDVEVACKDMRAFHISANASLLQIFEKSAFATEVGAALSITPNGARALLNLGFSFERARACKIGTWNSPAGRNLDRVGSFDLSVSEKTFGSAVWTVHGVDLLTDIQESKPATLRLNAQIVD